MHGGRKRQPLAEPFAREADCEKSIETFFFLENFASTPKFLSPLFAIRKFDLFCADKFISSILRAWVRRQRIAGMEEERYVQQDSEEESAECWETKVYSYCGEKCDCSDLGTSFLWRPIRIEIRRVNPLFFLRVSLHLPLTHFRHTQHGDQSLTPFSRLHRSAVKEKSNVVKACKIGIEFQVSLFSRLRRRDKTSTRRRISLKRSSEKEKVRNADFGVPTYSPREIFQRLFRPV